jgi:hypothetical protein
MEWGHKDSSLQREYLFFDGMLLTDLILIEDDYTELI